MGQNGEASFDVKDIWRVFWVLLIVTVIEFIIALAIPESFMVKDIKNVLYIVLTIMKAFYIVAYFMHLKFEKINLIYSILLPLVFIIGAIAALMHESNYWSLIK
ncbi:MAG: cytochrome C oxidase subunit IV family protein [Bacteroidia bacterium]